MTEPETQVPVLDTARLRLRCLMIEDAPAAHQAYGDPEAMRFWACRRQSIWRKPNAA